MLIPTQVEAAKALKIHKRTLRTWEKERWFPQSGRTADGYDVDAIRQARIAAGVAVADERAAETKQARAESGILRSAKTRLTRAHRLIHQLKLDKANGAVVDRQPIEQEITSIGMAFRETLEQLPALVGRQCCKPCRPKFEKKLPTLLEPRQCAFADAMEQCLKDFDARQTTAGGGGRPTAAAAPGTVKDALLSERVMSLSAKAQLAEKRFDELCSSLFPVAALPGLVSLFKTTGDVWISEVPYAAVGCCCRTCRGSVQADLERQLQRVWEVATTGMERLAETGK